MVACFRLPGMPPVPVGHPLSLFPTFSHASMDNEGEVGNDNKKACVGGNSPKKIDQVQCKINCQAAKQSANKYESNVQ